MTTILDTFNFRRRGCKSAHDYEWDVWADGKIRAINPRQRWGITAKTFQTAIHNKMKLWRDQGKFVYGNTSIMDGVVVFRIIIDGD